MIVKINDLDHYGRGLTKINGKTCFIENALPGETVEIEVIKEKKKYIEAKTIKVIKESSNRTIAPCPYYGECGGCDTMHMTYAYELEFKKNKVKNILEKYAGININLEIMPSKDELNYRNKITLHKSNTLGYMKKHSKEIIEIKSCPLAMKSINNYITNLKNVDEETIEIRTNEKGEITSRIDNKKIIVEINGLKFMIDANSFFQVNNYICEKIFNHLEKRIEKCNTCLDLYSGVGTLSIVASKKVNKVYGIEVNPYSHNNALKNLELNDISNVEFLLGKVEEKIKNVHEKIDLIITDPPRSGMDKRTLEIIKEFKPKKIIYISCDPMTLARDLNILKENYQITDITLFDMFPKTRHIETVAVLDLK